jgi:hypothetical protein
MVLPVQALSVRRNAVGLARSRFRAGVRAQGHLGGEQLDGNNLDFDCDPTSPDQGECDVTFLTCGPVGGRHWIFCPATMTCPSSVYECCPEASGHCQLDAQCVPHCTP